LEVHLPKYAHDGDAGLDIYSAADDILMPGEKKLIPAGFKIAIPKGYVGLIWDRSGMAVKHSIHTLAGVIDSGYRGEVSIVLKNLGSDEFKIEKNMRIAQMLIQPIVAASLKEVSSLDVTSRNEGGFGSTGSK
jgi:dUTP pyrophosphatase